MTAETEVNVPLLRKVIEWAEAEEAAKTVKPSQWDQTLWVDWNVPLEGNRMTELVCGTTCCIAGWVALQTLRPGEYINALGGITNKWGQHVAHCKDRAAQELGLNGNQVIDLFHTMGSIEEIRAIAEEIAGERL